MGCGGLLRSRFASHIVARRIPSPAGARTSQRQQTSQSRRTLTDRPLIFPLPSATATFCASSAKTAT